MKYFEVGACLQMLTGVCETSAVSTTNKEREGLYGVVLCSDLFSERADDLTIPAGGCIFVLVIEFLKAKT